jgi:hypothetical protein
VPVPFPPQKPKPFDRPSVESLSPRAVGCYGLFREDRWIYIGKGPLRERLLAHLAGEAPWRLEDGPTHWVAVETTDCDQLQEELVLACNPVCAGGGAR